MATINDRTASMPDGAKHKVTRFFLKAIDIPTNPQTTPLAADTSSTNVTTYINFMTKYYWVDSLHCYLDIGWEPWAPDASTNTHYQSISNDTPFTAPNVIVEVMGNSYGYNQTTALPDNIDGNNYRTLNIPANSILNSSNGTLKGNDAKLALKLEIVFVSGEDRNFNIGFGYYNTVSETIEGEEHNYWYLVNEKISNNNATINKYVTIPAPSRYENNVIFNEAGLNELIQNIKDYPVISVTGTPATGSQPYITVVHGSNPSQQVKLKVGSNITFPGSQSNDADGTFRVSIDGTEQTVPVKGISGISAQSGGVLIDPLFTKPSNGSNTIIQLGGADKDTNNGPYGTTSCFWRSDGTWSNELGANFLPTTHATNSDTGYDLGLANQRWRNLFLGGKLAVSGSDVDAIKWKNSNNTYVNGFNNTSTTYEGESAASISTNGGIYAAKNIWATRVFNAVFNDYAECRTTINLAPGHVVIDNDDGSLSCSSARLQPGAQVISDTYGHLMGGTETATTPIAVAGRVLVYTYQPRENYHAGMAVCSAPDGTVDIMTREEIRDYPDCIIGIISEIPQYDTWGTDNVKVNGRIWIKVR